MNGAVVHVYSKSKDGNTNITPNFKAREFACQDGTDTIFLSTALVETLQKIRNNFGKPITINSGYRTEAHNKKVGGSNYSQHKYGLAADIVVQGVAPATVAKYVETIMPTTGGIGLYKTFVHVDVRANKSRWNSTSGREVAVSKF